MAARSPSARLPESVVPVTTVRNLGLMVKTGGYLLDVAPLEAAAFVSLPLLLVWVGTLGVRVARTAR